MGIAMKHHVEMENLDYIQIHPTTLYSKKPGRRFLVSESVRGEGALLYDKNGQRFTNELQPRDLLSQKIFAQMEKDGTEFVWEDNALWEKKQFWNIFLIFMNSAWKKVLIREKSQSRLFRHSIILWVVSR